jgi:hypothetical protein
MRRRPRTLKPSRVNCLLCGLKVSITGSLGVFGLCRSCAILNDAAHVMGLSQMYVSIQEINGKVIDTYVGPVFKVA